VSCSTALRFFSTNSFQQEARMDATAGLQMSQPRPRPCLVSTSSKVLSSLMRTRWNNCWRVYGKCSHIEVLTVTPRFLSSAFSSCVTSGVQPPQVVPALVLVFNPPTVVQPAEMAEQMPPFETLLHEQICAVSGNALTPCPAAGAAPAAAPAGNSMVSGFSGSAIALVTVWCH